MEKCFHQNLLKGLLVKAVYLGREKFNEHEWKEMAPSIHVIYLFEKQHPYVAML